MDSKKKRKLNSNNTIGFTRVGKNGKRFTSKIRVESKKKYLGTHETAKAAALAYDRAVIDHKLASSGRKKAAAAAAKCNHIFTEAQCWILIHGSNVASKPYFVRDSMLDRLVAMAQNEKRYRRTTPSGQGKGVWLCTIFGCIPCR